MTAVAAPIGFQGLSDGPPGRCRHQPNHRRNDRRLREFALRSGWKWATLRYHSNHSFVSHDHHKRKPQNVFINGNTSTALTGAKGTTLNATRGIAFSNIDYNLWDGTSLMGTTRGHGITVAPDDTAASQCRMGAYPTDGGASYYFGLQNLNAGTGGDAAA